MRRERRRGERTGRSGSATFFFPRLAERGGWQPQRGGWRRTGQRAGRSGDGPRAPKRQSRRDPGRAFQSRGAAAVEAESEFPREPAQQAGRPCPTWNQNGRTSTSLLDLITSPSILPERGLGCPFWVGAPRGVDVPEGVLRATVQRTEGVSASFLKELMRRSAQFHLERDGSGGLSVE